MKSLLTLLLSFYTFVAISQEKPQLLTEIPVNTKARESAFSISGDGKCAVFLSNQKLYSCNLYGTAWGKPKPAKNINEALTDHSNITATSLSQDGNTLYFSANFVGGLGDEDIYFSIKENGEWSAPINVGEPINTAFYDGYPCLSNDGKKLYFVRDIFKKKGQENCYEIWVSSRQIGETWGDPRRLPTPINGECERSPRIMPDAKSLIFSSLREGGSGGFDFYQSEKQLDGTWSQPLPLEFINTAANEDFICFSGSGEVAYFEREGDIFSVNMPKQFRASASTFIVGTVLDSLTKKPISARITAANPTRSGSVSTFSAASDGSFRLNLNLNENYSFMVFAENFEPKTFSFDVSQAKQNEAISHNFMLSPTALDYAFEAVDETTKARIKNAKIIFSSADSSQQIITQSIDSPNGGINNQLITQLTIGKIYQISYQAEGYLPKTEKFTANLKNTTNQVFLKPSSKAISLPDNPQNPAEKAVFSSRKDPTFHLKKDSIYVFQNIYFSTMSTTIRSEAYGELNRLLQILRENSALRITIAAYTDSFGDAKFNRNLSEQRAKAVAKFLTDGGIESTRIYAEGRGKINEHKEQNQNRKVEFYLY